MRIDTGTVRSPASAVREGPLRCLTIDVEEYFHIEAARSVVHRRDWDRWPSRVEPCLDLILELLAGHGRRGTFFFLGDVARRLPHLARRVADAGHEIACHGMNHDRLHRLSAPELYREVHDARKLLEDHSATRVVGFRAPTFSLTPQTAWAVDVLAEAGFQYDASIVPVRHPYYGVPQAPHVPCRMRAGPGGATLLEVPALTWSPCHPLWAGPRFAVAGGTFRLLPLWFMRRGLDQAARAGRPAVLYFHPWEFDTSLPRMAMTWPNRLRTYTGLRTTAWKLAQIVREPARWLPIADALSSMRRIAAAYPVFDLNPSKPTQSSTTARRVAA